MTKPIVYTIPSGGSGTGWSYYKSALGCLRRNQLNEADGEYQPASQYSGAAVGTIAHVFMELHFGRMLEPKENPVLIEFSHAVDERARSEAERVFKAYRAKFPDPEHFGGVVDVEVQLPQPDSGEEIGDDDFIRRKEICEAVGVDPFTCRIDLAVEMNWTDIDRLQKERSMDGHIGTFEPGIWLIDHKFLGRKSPTLLDESLNSLQFTAYCLAWNAAFPDKPCKGMLQNTIFKTKVPTFNLTVVPFPSEQQIWMLRHTLITCINRMENEKNTCDPTRCYDWYKICHWRDNGCKGY